jgi:aldose 1-epimerase
VEGTPLDLRNGALLGERLTLPDPQLTNARGFNNFYQLSQGCPAVSLRHAPSGRALFLTTDLPWLAFYSGGYLDESLPLEGGLKGRQGCALALEPQMAPVTRQAREVSQVTTPEQPYDHWIAFRWTVEG